MLLHIRIAIFSAIMQYIMFDLYIAHCHIQDEYHIRYESKKARYCKQIMIKIQHFVKKLPILLRSCYSEATQCNYAYIRKLIT